MAEQLVKLCESKTYDLKSFERLFQRFYPVMCGIADRYLNDQVLSKDMVQEAFIKLWRRQENLNDIQCVKSYLYTTVRNLSLNYIRDHAQKEIQFEISSLSDLEDEKVTDLIGEETIYLLYRAIENLPPQSSKVILLVLQGKKNPEIAETLNISINSVKTLK